jgi:hypothetical protein
MIADCGWHAFKGTLRFAPLDMALASSQEIQVCLQQYTAWQVAERQI